MALIGVGLTQAARAATDAPLGRWEALRRDDLRVAGVAYRLARANTPNCQGATVPQPGLVLHGIEQYGAEDRSEAARRFGLGVDVGVMAAVPNSPVAMAGITAGDQLVSVNGQALLPLVDHPGMPTDARVMAVRQMLVAAMAKGAVTIRVGGAHGTRDVRFTAEVGCPAVVDLAPTVGMNAWADGHAVLIGAGLLARCASDDELALVIAHELAHNLLGHAARLARVNEATSQAGARLAAMRETEEEADRLGVRLATAAGYDLHGAGAFVSGLMASLGPDQPAATHPATQRRLALLGVDIAEANAGVVKPRAGT